MHKLTFKFHFLQFQLDQKAAVEAANDFNAHVPSPAETSPQLAEHLIRFALGSTADRLANSMGVPITATDLEKLPFQRTKSQLELANLVEKAGKKGARTLDAISQPAHSGDTSGIASNKKAGESISMSPNGCLTSTAPDSEESEEDPFQNMIRGDVLGDLSCVAISLSWPQNGAQENPNPPLRLFHPSYNLRKPSEIHNQSYYGSDLVPLARFRWAQVRMLCDYHRLYKREVVRRWSEVVQEIMEAKRKFERTVWRKG